METNLIIVYVALGLFALLGFALLITSIFDHHNQTTPKEEIQKRKEKEAQKEKKYREIKEEKQKQKIKKEEEKQKKKEQDKFDKDKKEKAKKVREFKEKEVKQKEQDNFDKDKEEKSIKKNQPKKDFFSWLKPNRPPTMPEQAQPLFQKGELNNEEQEMKEQVTIILEKIEKL